MRCKGCNKEIEEYEIFCDECKSELKKNSSKKDVKELEKLIENQNKLNELENTKELIVLDNLVEEEKLDEVSKTEIKEEIIGNNQKQIIRQKKNKKKLIIIISSIVTLVIITLIILFMFFKKDEPNEEEKIDVIDYQEVVNSYGQHIEKLVEDYIEKNNEVPTWQQIGELITYEKYEVECDTHNIYSDGTIYLNTCKINDKQTKYSYGKEKEEIKEGKKVEIYKLNYDNYYSYSSSKEGNFNLVGTITCKTENCKYIVAYDKYVLIEEDNQYYIYNYESNIIEFGPFNMVDEYSYENYLLVNDKTLYGIYYDEKNSNNIYNIKTGKTLKNIEGNLTLGMLSFNPQIMYKYNYAVFEKDNKYNFVNLKTGNISYTINDQIVSFIEDEKNKIVYMTAYEGTNYNKLKIYNSNGKLLFDGNTFEKINVAEGNLIVATDTYYKIYDSKLKVKLSSKNYDEILGLYEDFIVVSKDSDLKILSLEDKELANFENAWDKEKYIFHNMLSGWYTEDGKYGIYLVIENKELSYGTLGSGLEYYYIPNTQETGVIETEGVGGYAKPVLYLYPEEKTDITVTFAKPSMLTTTYPKFKNKWDVTAYPNGDLYDSKGNYYYALYWEEEQNHNIDFSKGFYVTKDNAIEFLEEKLSIIGLNAKERNEFIMYWLPILEKNQKSLVYFELTQERDKYNKLIINPKPDSILRVAIHVKKVNKKTSIKEQKLTKFKRNGFTAIEWGGVIY